jgi:Chalcone isomerase-like
MLCTNVSAQSSVTETSGIKFDNETTLHGNKLVLNGAGTRYKFVVKVYAAGLYVPAKVSTPEAAWDASRPRALKIVMLREIDANELGKLFTRGMQDNTTREEFGKAIPGTLKLAELFAARKKLVAGDYFVIDYQPGVGTVIVVNGKPETEAVKEPEFFSSLMKIWLGKSPADHQLKDALLGLK